MWLLYTSEFRLFYIIFLSLEWNETCVWADCVFAAVRHDGGPTRQKLLKPRAEVHRRSCRARRRTSPLLHTRAGPTSCAQTSRESGERRCHPPAHHPSPSARWSTKGKPRKSTSFSRKWRFSEPVTPCWACSCGESVTRYVDRAVWVHEWRKLHFLFLHFDRAQINDLSQVPVPVMLLPDDFKASTKIKVINHLFNKYCALLSLPYICFLRTAKIFL